LGPSGKIAFTVSLRLRGANKVRRGREVASAKAVKTRKKVAASKL